ncbi:IS3 family transposase [Corynebacterium macginleyi]|uniref:IS3 family transposase n=2 Tax=Corynebacterium macginleyi TaxID=38290 RepID=A0A3M0GF31_9CORY|nr:IS3 family transposase [Corynebacterium macginleyi]MBK4140785.1 IS3 family transposase [Corynebacterium macginleyi]MBK4142919.1 IS3 family transposase [Corynebacterium macginleyi]MBK4143460.1 IS3 family transposase [Corynebacterium macginleyi]MBK4147897.1 IS3 family transposase [Corynebacterium macginleyi]MBK4150362.1 IS3 family transposase [Corynebacterium macginleyi]
MASPVRAKIPRPRCLGLRGEDFDTAGEIAQALKEHIKWHNAERIPQGLEGLTPMQYRNQALKSRTAGN